jgi:hypothetical protein
MTFMTALARLASVRLTRRGDDICGERAAQLGGYPDRSRQGIDRRCAVRATMNRASPYCSLGAGAYVARIASCTRSVSILLGTEATPIIFAPRLVSMMGRGDKAIAGAVLIALAVLAMASILAADSVAGLVA